MRTRCPECDGLLKADAAWCPQCYADLRAPEPGSEPQTGSGPQPGSEPQPGGRPVSGRARHRAPDEGETPPGWPCPDCGTVNALAAGACATCGAAFLATLSSGRGDPALSGLMSMSRGARLGAALAAIVVLLALLAGVVWSLS